MGITHDCCIGARLVSEKFGEIADKNSKTMSKLKSLKFVFVL